MKVLKSFKLETKEYRESLQKKWKYINLVLRILSGIAIALIAYLIYKLSLLYMQ